MLDYVKQNEYRASMYKKSVGAECGLIANKERGNVKRVTSVRVYRRQHRKSIAEHASRIADCNYSSSEGSGGIRITNVTTVVGEGV